MDIDSIPQRKLRRPVLWFGLAALLLLAALFAAVAWKQGAFAKTTQLYFFANTGDGMNKGMAVKFRGFRIGTVEELSLEPSGKVKVRMVVENTYIRFVPQDSKAHLTKEGLIGASVIEIEPGETGASPVANNGVLAFARLRDYNDIAEELADQIQPILEEVKKITAFANDPDGDLRQTIKNINKASAALLETRQEISRLLQSSDRRLGAVSEQLGTVLGKASERLDQVGASLRSLDEKMPGLVLKADKTLDNIQAATANIKKITDDGAEQLPGIMRDSKAVAEDTREILDGARKSWPLRNFVPAPKETLIPLDSHDAGAPRK
jgi:phospholipid/cholesterol/gamma-HCH transport system substrate-binding protein